MNEIPRLELENGKMRQTLSFLNGYLSTGVKLGDSCNVAECQMMLDKIREALPAMEESKETH